MRRTTAAVGGAVFFVLGPGTVAVLVPRLLTGWQWRQQPYWLPVRVLGALLIIVDAIVLVHAFVRFVVEGSGTPVPAVALERLVIGGLYRYVRNPVYVALLTVIVGQALLLGRLGLLLYPAVIWLFAATFVRCREEPVLVRRFGAEYERYRRAVPAWVPRLRPWHPPRE
ncbi:methyltransferase family protein [Saccharopolyspora pogona]|uniref:methyltransferase family protein n=1 Tax=Saccharopolyspora pogona TaxID=333966 RepID=UPI001687AEA0|nr:isoprenylcysteine carboxylmethyltransferase family protein [Saccharopolyspora pogona]